MYDSCIKINPRCPQAYVSMGYTYHLQHDLVQALQNYHKAHFLNADDSLIEELI